MTPHRKYSYQQKFNPITLTILLIFQTCWTSIINICFSYLKLTDNNGHDSHYQKIKIGDPSKLLYQILWHEWYNGICPKIKTTRNKEKKASLRHSYSFSGFKLLDDVQFVVLMRLFAMDFFVLSFFFLSVGFRLLCFVAVVNVDDDVEFRVASFSFVSQLLMLPIRIISLSLSVGMRFPCARIKFTKNISLLFWSIVKHKCEILISQNRNSQPQTLQNQMQTDCKLGNRFLFCFRFDRIMSGTEKNRMSSSSHRRFRFVSFYFILCYFFI